MLQKTLQVLKRFEVLEGANIQIYTGGLIQKRAENAEINVRTNDSYVQVSLKDIHQDQLQHIYKELRENKIESILATYTQPGRIFKDFGYIDNVVDQGKTHLAHTPGEVLLVDVWATWCGLCQKSMQHNQEMLQKNEGVWGDKVKIIGVSVDEEKEAIMERVSSEKWDKITHLTLLGWKKDHQLFKDFKISGIPFVCLVNKWGKINYADHPSKIDFQAKINELLNEQQDSFNKPKAASVDIHVNKSQNEGIEKVASLLTKQNIQKEFKDVQLACFKYNKIRKLENQVESLSLKIHAYYVEGDEVAKNLVKKLFDKHQGVELSIKTVKYTPIPPVDHPECSLCQAKDLQYPFYWLRWEESVKFGCRACVQKKSQVQGHHYAYEKNSVLLLGKWEKVGTKDLGNNLQPADVTKLEYLNSGFCCNGCDKMSQGIGAARYISLGVRSDPNFKSGGYLDLCQQCMFKLMEKDHKVIDSLLPQGHKDHHPFLRVLYFTNGYFYF